MDPWLFFLGGGGGGGAELDGECEQAITATQRCAGTHDLHSQLLLSLLLSLPTGRVQLLLQKSRSV